MTFLAEGKSVNDVISAISNPLNLKEKEANFCIFSKESLADLQLFENTEILKKFLFESSAISKYVCRLVFSIFSLSPSFIFF